MPPTCQRCCTRGWMPLVLVSRPRIPSDSCDYRSMATVLVEGFDSDALALARFLANAGEDVRIAASSAAPPEAQELEELGITVERRADLDEDPGAADVAYLDVWTPEVARRVERLRSQGTRISCLGDLLLERWQGPTIGITGTAGKTTTTALVAAMLGASGSTSRSAAARARATCGRPRISSRGSKQAIPTGCSCSS